MTQNRANINLAGAEHPVRRQNMNRYYSTMRPAQPGGMKTYWCVTTSVDNRGRVVANITNTVEAVCKPENSSTSTSRRDIYNDWFYSCEEAQEFVEEAKRA